MAHSKNPINEYDSSSKSQERFDYSISNVKTCHVSNRYTNKLLLLTPFKDYFGHYLKLLLLQGGKLLFFFFNDTLNQFQLLPKDGKEKQTFTNPSSNLALHKIKFYT